MIFSGFPSQGRDMCLKQVPDTCKQSYSIQMINDTFIYEYVRFALYIRAVEDTVDYYYRRCLWNRVSQIDLNQWFKDQFRFFPNLYQYNPNQIWHLQSIPYYGWLLQGKLININPLYLSPLQHNFITFSDQFQIGYCTKAEISNPMIHLFFCIVFFFFLLCFVAYTGYFFLIQNKPKHDYYQAVPTESKDDAEIDEITNGRAVAEDIQSNDSSDSQYPWSRIEHREAK